MGDSTSPIINWNANSEPDLAGYKIYFGQVANTWLGIITAPLVFLPVPPLYTIPINTFTSDGIWYFAVSAYDTSNNESSISTIVNRRIIRVQSKFARRKL
jgi:hypothetical protein